MLIFSSLLYFQNGLWITISLWVAKFNSSAHLRFYVYTKSVLKNRVIFRKDIFNLGKYIQQLTLYFINVKENMLLIICIFHNFIGDFRRSCFTILIRRNAFILLRSININLLLKMKTSSNFIQPFKIMLTQVWWWKHGNEIQTKEIKFPLKTHFFVFTYQRQVWNDPTLFYYYKIVLRKKRILKYFLKIGLVCFMGENGHFKLIIHEDKFFFLVCTYYFNLQKFILSL